MSDIWIDCEGVGSRVHFPQFGYPDGEGDCVGMCAMCGELVDAHHDATAKLHQRRDILAMLDRGDFNP